MSQSNPILTAIIHGMRQSHLSNQVRLAATTALYNSLEFTKANFDNEVRKNKLFLCDFYKGENNLNVIKKKKSIEPACLLNIY